MPYLHYDEVEFDVIVGTYGDASTATRSASTRSARACASCARSSTACPAGDYRIQNKKVTPPPRARIDESMEALIHHFKIFTEGFKVPEGEVYVAIESPRGEIGCYIASDGSATPYRMHVRAPSFVNIQCLPHMMRGGLVADAVAVISSRRPGPRERLTGNEPAQRSQRRSLAKEIIGRYPKARSATIPLLHLAQQQDGYVTNEAIAHIAELVGATSAEVLGTATFYEMFKFEPVGKYLDQHLRHDVAAAAGRRRADAPRRADARASRPAAPPPTACSRWSTPSARRRAPRRRPCR